MVGCEGGGRHAHRAERAERSRRRRSGGPERSQAASHRTAARRRRGRFRGGGRRPRRPSRADAFLLSPLRRGTPRLDRRQNRARRALLRRRARQDVPVRPRRLPGDVRVGARAQRIRLGRRAHVRGEDGGGGVRHRHGLPGQAARRVHIPAQSVVQPEVQGAHRGVRRRRTHDWRRVHQPQRFLHRHDHRGAAWDAVPGQRRGTRGEVDHLRRGALHEGQGARSRVGRIHRLRSERVQIRVSLRHAAQRARVCRVDHALTRAPVPRGVHRLQTHAVAALRLSQGWQRPALDRQRAERVPGVQLRHVASGAGRDSTVGEET